MKTLMTSYYLRAIVSKIEIESSFVIIIFELYTFQLEDLRSQKGLNVKQVRVL